MIFNNLAKYEEEIKAVRSNYGKKKIAKIDNR